MNSASEQMALIRRGVEQLVPEEEMLKKLQRSIQSGKPLRVKYGIDPTGIDVHLGHTVPLRKLRLFQDLGHQAVIIIGNYTALVGDPSGRDQSRVRLTQEQVEKNAVDYLKQISKIVDISKAEIHANGDWFAKMSFLDVMSLCSKITVQRMLERDDFTKRVKAGTPVYLHECLYPLMQGRDSVEIRADIELGGSEQLFNLMMGRHLQSDAGQEPQICITLPILRGLDGVRRMGKSLGNYVGVAESAYDIFAKVMSIPDDLMAEWFELLTDRPKPEITALVREPMAAKQTLGKDIAGYYHGPQSAVDAESEWKKRFSQREDPTEIPEVVIPAAELVDGKIQVFRLAVVLGFAKSNNDARRLVQGGAINTGADRVKLADPTALVALTDGMIVRSGSKRVVKILVR